MTFQNPINNYVESTSDLVCLWVFLFGSFYWMYRGMWGHAFLHIVVGFVTFGIGHLIMPFLAQGMIRKHYLRRGWKEIS